MTRSGSGNDSEETRALPSPPRAPERTGRPPATATRMVKKRWPSPAPAAGYGVNSARPLRGTRLMHTPLKVSAFGGRFEELPIIFSKTLIAAI
jgi:hypothetical protein